MSFRARLGAKSIRRSIPSGQRLKASPAQILEPLPRIEIFRPTPDYGHRATKLSSTAKKISALESLMATLTSPHLKFGQKSSKKSIYGTALPSLLSDGIQLICGLCLSPTLDENMLSVAEVAITTQTAVVGQRLGRRCEEQSGLRRNGLMGVFENEYNKNQKNVDRSLGFLADRKQFLFFFSCLFHNKNFNDNFSNDVSKRA